MLSSYGTDEQQRNLKQIVVPNFSIHTTKVREDTEKVRIVALIRNDIKFKIREDLMKTGLQTIWIEIIKHNSKNVLCGGVYREWSSECPEDDADEIINQFHAATKENKPTVILGDMNLDTKVEE